MGRERPNQQNETLRLVPFVCTTVHKCVDYTLFENENGRGENEMRQTFYNETTDFRYEAIRMEWMCEGNAAHRLFFAETKAK